MLPESDPNRIVAARDLSCYNCSTPIPKAVGCYEVANTPWCDECYTKRQSAHAAEPNPPRNAADDEIEWPEDMFENIVVDPLTL
jgi:hypothetical protein